MRHLTPKGRRREIGRLLLTVLQRYAKGRGTVKDSHSNTLDWRKSDT